MYLVINLKHVLSSGLIGALVGIGTAGLFLAVKFLVWKDKVPDWISKFRWILGFVLGFITCYIYYELGGDRNSGTLVIAAVCFGIGYTFKNESPKENENKETETNTGQYISDKLNNIEIDSPYEGSIGSISDNINYEVLKIVEKFSFLGEKKFMFNIKFSDENKGDLYYSVSDKSYFIMYRKFRAYYKNKEAALKGLHYQICNNKILDQDRHYVV